MHAGGPHLCGLVALMACAGMRIVAVARRKDRLEELQRHMHALGVPLANFLPVVCDITKEAEVGLAGGGAQRRGRGWLREFLQGVEGTTRRAPLTTAPSAAGCHAAQDCVQALV